MDVQEVVDQLEREAHANLEALSDEDESVRGHYEGYISALNDLAERLHLRPFYEATSPRA